MINIRRYGSCGLMHICGCVYDTPIWLLQIKFVLLYLTHPLCVLHPLHTCDEQAKHGNPHTGIQAYMHDLQCVEPTTAIGWGW